MRPLLLRQMRRLQRQLEQFYGLERAPSVRDYTRLGAANTREQLLVKESQQGIYLAVVFPEDQIPAEPLQPNDNWTQLIEAVSHYLFISERARIELPTTQLELELQAEIDKFVVLRPTLTRADRDASPSAPGAQRDDERSLVDLHRWLYEDVRFLHACESEAGARYRLANRLAARYVNRLLRLDPLGWQRRLRAFYRVGQTEKIAIALAA
ncbi:MAG TPA: hypothetical protein VIV60_32940 [Polyangiaceae bacterium]